MQYVRQMKAARALLGWNQGRLAEEANIAISTVKRIELGEGYIETSMGTARQIQRAFEQAGVRFIDASEQNGPGVMLAEKPPETD